MKTCERCEQTENRTQLHHRCDDDPYRQTCREPRCDSYECDRCRDNRSEAAHESMLSDYYGGSSPQTLDEQQAAARNLKEGRS